MAKKANMETTQSENEPIPNEAVPSQMSLQHLIEPIMQEIKSLKDTMTTQKCEISQEISHLKTIIMEQKADIVDEKNIKVDHNSKKIE